MSCCLHMRLITIEYHTLRILSIYLHVFVTLKSLFESDTVGRFFFYHGSTCSNVGCKVLSQSVATTEALKESCNLSLSWTLLTRRGDYLSVKPSQKIIWASIVFLSAFF